MKFKEIEYKYSLPFTERVPKELLSGLLNSKFVAGFDYYYTDPSGAVIRFRDGQETKELTTKANSLVPSIRTTVRDEINLELSNETSITAVTKFCNLLGFAQSLQVYKRARIFYYEDHIISQYTVKAYNGGPVYDTGDFLEIELKEGAYTTQEESIARLEELEQKYSALGIGKENRINKSLYEIYAA